VVKAHISHFPFFLSEMNSHLTYITTVSGLRRGLQESPHFPFVLSLAYLRTCFSLLSYFFPLHSSDPTMSDVQCDVVKSFL